MFLVTCKNIFSGSNRVRHLAGLTTVVIFLLIILCTCYFVDVIIRIQVNVYLQKVRWKPHFMSSKTEYFNFLTILFVFSYIFFSIYHPISHRLGIFLRVMLQSVVKIITFFWTFSRHISAKERTLRILSNTWFKDNLKFLLFIYQSCPFRNLHLFLLIWLNMM